MVVHFDREVILNFEDTSQADFVGEASTPVGPEIEGISLSDFVEKKSDCSTEEGIAKVGFVEEAFILTVVVIGVGIMRAATGEDTTTTTIITTTEVGTTGTDQVTVGEDTTTTTTTVVEVGTGQEDTTSIGKVVKLVAFLINRKIINLTFY